MAPPSKREREQTQGEEKKKTSLLKVRKKRVAPGGLEKTLAESRRRKSASIRGERWERTKHPPFRGGEKAGGEKGREGDSRINKPKKKV